ncbi:RNI-like protein [Lophium mytilinum]|uniref:RNI-like protein n=1 Tax=Lophium mytilinum TaxID=390894 RepID=A0A6A6REZ1_9PEZI|nr:RNI-like protein [Lophium mytilinum]
MEDHSGVDVSWLHHSNRDHHHRLAAPSSPGLARDAPPRTSTHGGLPEHQPLHTPSVPITEKPPSPPPSSATSAAKPIPKRPNIIGRQSSEKTQTLTPTPPDSKSPSRRNSWINSISSKFSSAQNTLQQPQLAPTSTPPSKINGAQGPTSLPVTSATGANVNSGPANETNAGPPDSQIPQTPKAGSSFFSNALRRLSSGSQASPLGKVSPHGAICPRKVMNVDLNRDRCLVPELEQSKLRRVAFCVDVEIAGGPRYKDEGDCEDKKKKRKDKKLKERGEGEALKHPEAVVEEKEKAGLVNVTNEAIGTEEAPDPEGPSNENDKDCKRREKKKRSEAERKERKEKKRRKAEENGSVPLELSRDDDEASPNATPAVSGTSTPKAQDRPTTDPLRIYRRCCQLRETPILKRVSDQLSHPHSCAAALPGVVTCLDLTGSRLQLADIVTLGDWLAIVPVMKLVMDDSDLTDEKTRVVLAGLLSAKVPESLKRRSGTYDRGQNGQIGKSEKRTGVIEKLSLKNNPKITREGWKHISLFIYMCKPLKAIDVSMVPFPRAQNTPSTNGTASTKEHLTELSDTLCKAISERLGGSRLEELILAECSLSTQAIRRIIDAVTVSGIQRLGLAGNDIDDEGLDHVIRYVRSGVCQGLDLGGNDLRNGIGRLCASFPPDCGLCLLSLADCNLEPDSLKPLLPALAALPNFRFLDLSHNRDLFSTPLPRASLYVLRKYLPLMKNLKRIHLMDVSMSPVEAIGLAEVLPECPHLAHLNILENPQLSIVSSASDEESQEDACALYASLMAAVRVSNTIICIDVEVPGPETGEVVKALAKQVVAYCLRNMERLTEVSEFSGIGDEKDVIVPEVLQHLVGRGEGSDDDDEPAPDDDYIVGGTGVVKALSYCLLQKASELRRPSHPTSGATTPSHVGVTGNPGKALNMSKNLLESARNIRARLQPAIVRESRLDNDMGYRRLLFLDQTLQGMIQRFEEEYPECRLDAASNIYSDAASTHSSAQSSSSPPTSTAATFSTSPSDTHAIESDDEERKSSIRSRHNSDVSLASRALSMEEGRIHRLGQRVRAEIYNNSRPSSSSGPGDPLSRIEADSQVKDGRPTPTLDELRSKLESLTGEELRLAAEGDNWEENLHRIGQNAEEIRRLKHESPEEFKAFSDAQRAARFNAGKEHKFHAHGSAATRDQIDSAIED